MEITEITFYFSEVEMRRGIIKYNKLLSQQSFIAGLYNTVPWFSCCKRKITFFFLNMKKFIVISLTTSVLSIYCKVTPLKKITKTTK